MNTTFKTFLLLPAVCLTSAFYGFSEEQRPPETQSTTKNGGAFLNQSVKYRTEKECRPGTSMKSIMTM